VGRGSKSIGKHDRQAVQTFVYHSAASLFRRGSFRSCMGLLWLSVFVPDGELSMIIMMQLIILLEVNTLYSGV